MVSLNELQKCWQLNKLRSFFFSSSYFRFRSVCFHYSFHSDVMGLLTEGSPLSWEETEKYANHVRQHGVVQFIKLYHRLKDRQNDCLKWGDEVSVYFKNVNFILLFILYSLYLQQNILVVECCLSFADFISYVIV